MHTSQIKDVKLGIAEAQPDLPADALNIIYQGKVRLCHLKENRSANLPLSRVLVHNREYMDESEALSTALRRKVFTLTRHAAPSRCIHCLRS